MTLSGFSFHPDLTILENFLLPDRYDAFQLAYGPLASLESGATMRRAYCDDDAGFADLQSPGAMNYADVRNIEPLARLASQTPHFAQGHRRVGFVNQVERSPSLRPFARITVQRH